MIVINDVTARKRADVVLADAHTSYSRAALSKLFGMGLVWINDIPARPGDKVKPGQVFKVDLTPLEDEPDVIDLPVLFENDDVIVVDKPAGIISHARGRFWQEASVASFIRDKTKGMVGERAGIVHRLDRATSGVMIAAKHERAQSFLQNEFSKKRVFKEYVALIHGTPDKSEAHIIAALGRNPNLPQQFKVDATGKQAETIYKIIATNGKVTQVQLHPLTGRTHQLRVHMLYIGHPIIGDPLYSQESKDESRMFLHAKILKIHLPDGVEHTFEAPVSAVFTERLARG